MARKKAEQLTTAASVKSYKHRATRSRIPTQEESKDLSPREKQPVKKKYAYDPSLDPQLVWAGKQEEGEDLSVSTVPIYVQENIAPEGIIARLKMRVNEELPTPSLFGDYAADQAHHAVDFYKHEDNWKNRMILGDSLIVMNSLLEKEGMRGKVQTIYIDPPYGIKFGSNWQTSTRKRDVKDNKLDDMIRQPEQIKAFRDTWELGIHSYLSYLRDRLITARELLTESGSCFVQINDENVHLVRNLMDEVFGSANFCSEITFNKTGGFSSSTLANVNDYLIWYAKDLDKIKYRHLYFPKYAARDAGQYNWVELPDGQLRQMTDSELDDTSQLPPESRIFAHQGLASQGEGKTPPEPVVFEGEAFKCPANSHWKTTLQGIKRLIEKGRLFKLGKSLRYKRYLEDFPVLPMNNTWVDVGVSGFGDKKIYAVQTNTKVIQRAMLMTTDPGDIILDPTCGSGTTAYVAEQWGRRWITTDTSRVALALARTRLMTAKFPYYKLKENGDDAKSNVAAGFICKTVPHVTLKSLANDEEAEQEVLYDQPLENKDVVRVCGPFTVESLAPHRVSDAQEMVASERFVETVVDNLKRAGVQTGEKGARVEFENLEILPSGPEVQAVGEYKTKDGLKKVAVAIGPEFGSIDDDFIRDAARVAKKFADLLVVAATSFDASAFTEAKQQDGLTIMRVKINPDLSMGDLLKKTGSGNLFLSFGEPEVKVKKTKEGVVAEILGMDVYDPVRSEIRSSGDGELEHDIAAWFIDTNYNDEAFYVTHAYFLGADKPYEKLKKALKADIPEEVWDELHSTVSRPFPKPTTGKIAIKVINHYGDEVMKVLEIK
ncbi:MAG: site-specific DNA-methyltransferase [Patescibacteria group bacterium]|nr:site-specific DNA-methyltransferase [Patescibacteria group bacterium]MDE1944858.1 site-specific DNA-methyltransferase [Patescibacteria group bacterium]MDE2057304.1 site-specific DNA-methyltransferase [Patescibacteria group bacterium]